MFPKINERNKNVWFQEVLKKWKHKHTLWNTCTRYSQKTMLSGEDKWQMRTPCTAQFLRNAKPIKPSMHLYSSTNVFYRCVSNLDEKMNAEFRKSLSEGKESRK